MNNTSQHGQLQLRCKDVKLLTANRAWRVPGIKDADVASDYAPSQESLLRAPCPREARVCS